MILHRLRLTNFRGIADRELTFPEQGVVVVCGPNEIGKSSMLEALDLLLEYKDRSNNQKVKQVQPAHADVGSEVTAEISTGPYRFTYHKRFHRKPVTELTILEPARSQLRGDEAHEAVQTMLEQTVDTRLWEAQRVLQSAATEAVNLSGSDALARALDAAAGEVSAPGGTETLLIDGIEAEFARYFTGTGRPTKDWKAALERLAAAERAVQDCRDAVEEVDERVRRHEDLVATRAGLLTQLDPAAARLCAAQSAAAALDALVEKRAKAELVATAAAGTSTASAAARESRQKLVADVERRSATFAELAQLLTAAAEAQTAAAAAAGLAEEQSTAAGAAVAAAEQRTEAARAAAEACTAREAAEHLAARLQRIDDVGRDIQRVDTDLAAITLTTDVLADIEQSAVLVERLGEQLRADAGSVAFTAPDDLTVTVDGEPMNLCAGQTWTAPVSAAVTVEVPGVLSVCVAPAAGATEIQAKLEAAQAVHIAALAQGGVVDVAAARAAHEHRRALAAERSQLTAKLEGACLGEDPEDLRAKLEALRAAAGGSGADAEAAASELRAAAEALGLARTEADACHAALAAATAELAEQATAATVLREQVSTAEAELSAVRRQLADARADADDAAVAAAAATHAEEHRVAAEQLAALTAEYQAANPEAVYAELEAAGEHAETLNRRLAQVDTDLAALTAQLEVIGSEGRQGKLDDAEAELERARIEHTRIGERAAAARLLRDTMLRHRDNTRQRYVQPYRTELEKLGRKVFGPDFRVEVDTDLSIVSRTMDGCTVPFGSLSGGAKEQLGILARLAGAALVADEDTVPVVIDDALGFTDSDRLAKMGAVFDTVGGRGQVIVLTCQQDRYAGIPDATVIQLSA